MKFPTRVDGIPCQCHVLAFSPPYPAGTFLSEEECTFDYEILDRKGYKAPWLERKLTDQDKDRFLQEYQDLLRQYEQ